jgi:amino acid transporter
MQLKRSMNSFTLLASAIAGIVGGGWLLGPLACARIAGPAASITWLIGGILMMAVAACFVMLARALPLTGGTVRYFQLTYGHFAGFSFSWIAWLAWVAVSPIETMALLQYSANYIPHIMTTGSNPLLTGYGVMVAMALMTIIYLINSRGTKTYNKVNQFILAFKMLIPVATVAVLFSTHFHASNFVSSGSFMPYGVKSIFAALPLAGVIYSFIGFNPAIQLAAETKNPKRAVPIAIFGSLAITIVLYTLIQIAFIGALPSANLAHGWNALTFIGDNGPFAGLLTGLGFVWFVKALYIDATISPFGTAMVHAMATSRLTYAMGENNYFPKWVKHISKRNTPSRALIMNLLVGFCFFMPFPSWQHMVGFLVSCLVLGYVIGPMSLMIISKTHADKFPQHSACFINSLCFIAFYVCNLLIFWSGWATVYKVAICFAIGYGVIAIKIFFSPNPKQQIRALQIKRGSWVIIYIIGITCISALSSFGGDKLLKFGPDFIAVAAFTLAIFILAKQLAKNTAAPESK